jgi:hypothetical protein
MIPSAIPYQHHFQKEALSPKSYSLAMAGTVIKHTERDKKSWHEYLERVLKSREGWEEWYTACSQQLKP